MTPTFISLQVVCFSGIGLGLLRVRVKVTVLGLRLVLLCVRVSTSVFFVVIPHSRHSCQGLWGHRTHCADGARPRVAVWQARPQPHPGLLHAVCLQCPSGAAQRWVLWCSDGNHVKAWEAGEHRGGWSLCIRCIHSEGRIHEAHPYPIQWWV